MNSENEQQFGRRRSFKKPLKTKTEVEKQPQSENGKIPDGEKSPDEILKILEAEKPTDQEPKEKAEVKPKSETMKPEPKTEMRDNRRGQDRRQPRGRSGSSRHTRDDRSKKTPQRQPSQRVSKQRRPGGAKLSIIIPAYNEAGNINELLSQFDELFRNLPYRAEMILIDDGSTDKTLELARAGQNKYNWLNIYKHRANMGLTAALETGFKHANGKVLCFYPADLQYHANEIPKMVSRIDSGADVVTGWKQGKYSKSFGSFIYNKLSRWLFKVRVHDLNSIKMFKREVVESFTYRSGWHRYMIVMAAQAGFNIEEIKVKLFPRKNGKSKFGMSQLPIGFLDLLSVKFELSFTTKPLLFFGTAGITCGLLGFIIGVIAIYLRFVEHAGFRPLLYAVILLVVSGLMLFAIGFLAELIVSVKEQIQRKK